MTHFLRAFACGVFAVAAVSASPAFAIKQFKKGFAEQYQLDVNKVSCNSCHVAEKSKKHLSEYGKEAGKLLKKKDFGAEKLVGDEAQKAIRAALEKIDGVKSADGTSYGDLIRAGKLPGMNDVDKKDDDE